ncbi:hypothetical protein ES332_D08G151000v1 [Gossypium tomentosum]|uniref:Reverse transcriptase Ty1/copia-type domain-containing protein n=1 Tax=Gossypium tomentosum TaxID=34277 RepID=A0A5D2JV94_GOSTO|nr:hypothetical protein ES332_D08G151000v1 [Gossypium tomentosum]
MGQITVFGLSGFVDSLLAENCVALLREMIFNLFMRRMRLLLSIKIVWWIKTCFFTGDSLISWRSKKRIVVARSGTKFEYRTLADDTLELLWLRRLLEDMGLSSHTTTILHCDNLSAI